MMIANYRVFLLQAHPIQLLHHFCIKTLFYGQLSAYANNPLALSDIFGQSIRLAFHDAGEIDLTNSTDFMGPDGCISNTRPNSGLFETTSYCCII